MEFVSKHKTFEVIFNLIDTANLIFKLDNYKEFSVNWFVHLQPTI